MKSTLVLAAFLAAAPLLSLAQAPAQPAKIVTKDELRACMDSEADLAARRQGLESRNKLNGEEAANIRAEQVQMAAEKEKLEADNANMDRFNRKVRVHNERIQAARAGSDTFRADLDTFNKALTAHNDKCGGISFRAEDKEAILKEREAAKK